MQTGSRIGRPQMGPSEERGEGFMLSASSFERLNQF